MDKDDDNYKQQARQPEDKSYSYIGINWLKDRNLAMKILNLVYQLCKILDACFWFYFVPILPVILSFDMPEQIQARGNLCNS